MPENRRSYRTNLTSSGLIYLEDEELEVSVRNLSITGVLAELKNNTVIKDIKDVFKSIKATPIVDIYLSEMRLAGEAEVIRADLVDGQIFLALEFKNVSFDVNNLLYKRKAYRKNLIAPGQILFDDKKHQFSTKNVSVDGLMIELEDKIEVKIGTVTIFDFKQLQIRGEIEVVWLEHNEDDSTLIGLKYVNMKREDIKGIPRFSTE